MMDCGHNISEALEKASSERSWTILRETSNKDATRGEAIAIRLEAITTSNKDANGLQPNSDGLPLVVD